MLIYPVHVIAFFVVRKVDRIQLKAIGKLIETNIACFGKSFSDQFGAVVLPAGVYGYLFLRVLVFQQPKYGRIMVIRRFDIVAPDIVLVYPGSGEQAIVADGRDRGRFGIRSGSSDGR
jgi:hypothetical protein